MDAHDKVAGASRGPDSTARAAGDRGVAPARAPPGDSYAFVSSLRSRAVDGSPAAAAALSALLPAAAPTIARLLDLGWSASGDGGSSKDDSRDDSRDDSKDSSRVVDADAAAALLGDVCDVLSRLDGGEGEIVLRAAPAAAAKIAARCESSNKRGGSESGQTPARRRWALLRALPHCAARDGVRRATADAIAWALGAMGADAVDGLPAADAGYAAASSSGDAAAVLAAAMAARAAAGPEPRSENVDVRIAARVGDLEGEYPAALVAAAGSPRRGVRSVGDWFLRRSGDPTQPAAQVPSRHQRVGALRYLCAVADASGECDAADARAAGANDTPRSLAECLHRG